MRTTKYAAELAHAAVPDGDSEARVERLRIRATDAEEIRFSWWKQDRMIPRPLDLPEPQLVVLLARAVAAGVLAPAFVDRLRDAIAAEHTA